MCEFTRKYTKKQLYLKRILLKVVAGKMAKL